MMGKKLLTRGIESSSLRARRRPSDGRVPDDDGNGATAGELMVKWL
jgi:hypothetical protein